MRVRRAPLFLGCNRRWFEVRLDGYNALGPAPVLALTLDWVDLRARGLWGLTR